jgi:adenosylcobinamide kinase/adenosylcobinamide-phosphate guanylyltransferase
VAITLIGGGSRSGKSTYALKLARERGHRLGYIATAEAGDAEMAERIRLHQIDRGRDFVTIEEPLDLTRVLQERVAQFDAVVIDCLTLWLSNHLMIDREPPALAFLDTAAATPLRCILVTNEVGCGLVPESALARRFRDLAGRLNQDAAARADEVYWMAFGLPLRLK